jgi:hypothetical protein
MYPRESFTNIGNQLKWAQENGYGTTGHVGSHAKAHDRGSIQSRKCRTPFGIGKIPLNDSILDPRECK